MTRWERFKQWVGFRYEPKTALAELYDDEAVQRYIDTGLVFGDAVSSIYMGECIGFHDMLKEWEAAERVYAGLGYRTIDLDAFVGAGGWGKELEGLIVDRAPDEEPVYHAEYYRDRYLGRLAPVIDFDEMARTGKAQRGTYAAPSTKHLNIVRRP